MLAEFEHQISDVKIIPARGGVYEVSVDGDLIYSKKATGRHAEHEEILRAIRARLPG